MMCVVLGEVIACGLLFGSQVFFVVWSLGDLFSISGSSQCGQLSSGLPRTGASRFEAPQDLVL